MSLQHGHDEKGEWLKITYYDEDGADVSERFRMKGQYWQVREKVIEYEGRFRLAHELRG